ncbi:hypothetical protein BLOT_003207 [Blomia tropicalis]|nr:hypothetical protein BLOT_003207 [Blomia tropicalis]
MERNVTIIGPNRQQQQQRRERRRGRRRQSFHSGSNANRPSLQCEHRHTSFAGATIRPNVWFTRQDISAIIPVGGHCLPTNGIYLSSDSDLLCAIVLITIM